MSSLADLALGAEFPAFQPGSVWLVGAGPGDPGLLTLHALHALKSADVVVYDALVSPQILAWANPDAAQIYAGKRGGKPSPKQGDISLQLIALAQAGKRVLRLKGGDPFVFGRGGEEALALVAAGVKFRIVPGITAGIGGLAYAGIPVTHRDITHSVTFLTGHDQSGATPSQIDWPAIARACPVLVLYMAIKHIGEIAGHLLGNGRSPDEPVAVVVNATLPEMQVLETTLGRVADDIVAHDIQPPAIICIGQNASLRLALEWQSGNGPRTLNPLAK